MKFLDVGLPRKGRFPKPALRFFDHALCRVDARHSSTPISEHFQKGASATTDFQDRRVWTNQLGCNFLSNLLKFAEGQEIHPAIKAPGGLLENLH